jgi:MFS family permease
MAYALLVASAFLFELALDLPVGSLPLALDGDGASHGAVAAAMGSGMFAALLASLPLGALVDRFGRLRIMRVSALAGALSLLTLTFVHGAAGGSALLALRSIAFIGYMTAEFAYAGDLAMPGRAVSTVATLGMIGTLTFATAPALGIALWQHGVAREQFAWSAAVALAGAALLWALPAEPARQPHASTPPMFRREWLPAIAFGVTVVLQPGVNGTLAVLTFHDRGVANGAALFSASALVAFALRYAVGRLIERFGPRRFALGVVLAQLGAALLAARAQTLTEVIVAGVLLGVGWAGGPPVLIALLFETTDERTRGAAMGAYNFASGSGAACGAVLATLATLLGGGYALAVTVAGLAPLAVVPFILRSKPPAGPPRLGDDVLFETLPVME